MTKKTVGSLFAGIGGFDLGFDKAGLETAWQVELDGACNSVLKKHWPNVGRFLDVRDVGSSNLEAVDVIVGGFPCQDLSVAGKRGGLEGERSGLFYECARIIGELRPKWIVIENVPGLLSSNQGEDFVVVLETLTKFGYGVAWRVLDSQYFGVAQRRRRVFIVGCLGDGRRAAEVLFEPESLCGNTAPSREAGKRIAASLTRGAESSGKGGYAGRRREDDVNLVAASGFFKFKEQDVCTCLRSNQAKATDTDLVVGKVFVKATNHHSAEEAPRFEEAEVTATLNTAEVHAVAQNQRGEVRTSDIHPQLTCGGGKPGEGYPCVAIPFDTTQITSPGNYSEPQPGDECHPLAAKAHAPCVAFKSGQSAQSRSLGLAEEQSPTLPANQDVSQGMTVRRLTPTECERLQGFPDGWTEGVSDSARYRMLGNAVTVNVAQWIGRRIAAQNNP